MPKKILVVLTTTEKYPNLNRATGVWLGEAVHFVERVERAGFVVDYVSPTGGYTPIDPHSLAMAEPSIGSGTTIANLWTVSARRSNPLT